MGLGDNFKMGFLLKQTSKQVCFIYLFIFGSWGPNVPRALRLLGSALFLWGALPDFSDHGCRPHCEVFLCIIHFF